MSQNLQNFMQNITQNITQIAIGNFDGIHKAHQVLIKKLGKNGAVVVILNENKNLTPYKFRENFSNLPFIYFELNTLRNLSGGEFLDFLSKKFPHLNKIVVGYDFRFGKDRAFDTNFLRKNFSGEVYVMPEFKIEGIGVHSSLIKDFLDKGELENAKKFLGRDYEILGEIVKGQGLGKVSLVATLNIRADNFYLPKNGVYSSFCSLDNSAWQKSVSFIGVRESTDGNFAIETHILENFSDKNYKNCRIKFIKFLRENRKFSDLNALKSQISEDIQNAEISLKGKNER